MLRGSENPSSTRPVAGQAKRAASVAAVGGAAEASGPGGAAGAGVVSDGPEGGALEDTAAGPEPDAGVVADVEPAAGRAEVAPVGSARVAEPLASDRRRGGAESFCRSLPPPARIGSLGAVATGDACAAGGRDAVAAGADCAGGVGRPAADEGVPAGAGRVAAGAGAGRAGVVVDGGVAVERFSTGAGRGAAHPANPTTDASATTLASRHAAPGRKNAPEAAMGNAAGNATVEKGFMS